MNTKFDPSTIPADKTATFNQIRKVAIRFSTPEFTVNNDKPHWGLVKVNIALILKHHNEVVKKELNHGQVQELLKGNKLPEQYTKLYKAPAKKVKKIKKLAPSVKSLEDELKAF